MPNLKTSLRRVLEWLVLGAVVWYFTLGAPMIVAAIERL